MLVTRMHEYRKRIGITQEELAELVECRRETIGKIENGKYNPSLRLAMRIATVFGATVEDVFFFEGEEWQTAKQRP